MTPETEALCKRLSDARANVYNTRMTGITGYLAGWEHQVMDEAAAKLREMAEALEKAAQIAGDAFWNLPMPKHWDRDKQEYADWCARQSKFVREQIAALAGGSHG